ncbi:MAG: hypothetical protein ACI4O7_02030 [Aristaeellaceae bacterium]
MNKLFALMLTAVFAMTGVGALTGSDSAPAADEVSAETLPEVVEVSGVISEITGDYLLLEDQDGQTVQANLTPDTLVEYDVTGSDALAAGDYVTVLYNGMMTRSLPPQVTALTIRSVAMTGTVTALEENRFLMVTGEGMEVAVNCTLADWPAVAENARVRVYFSGAMTMSLPGQIGALLIVAAE